MITTNRMLTILGAAYAYDVTDNGMRHLIFKDQVQAWMFKANGKDLTPYKGGRTPSDIYVYEKDLDVSRIKRPIPEPQYPLPEGKLILKNAAASIAGESALFLEQSAKEGMIQAFIYDPLGINLLPATEGEMTSTTRILYLEESVKAYKAKRTTTDTKQDRRLTLQAVAHALNRTLPDVRNLVLSGDLPAWVYKDSGGIGQYEKKTGARHSLIFVKESALRGLIVNELPPPLANAPTGEIMLKEAAAAYLGISPHTLQGWAEVGRAPAYVYADGVNLIPLPLGESRKGESQILHFRKADLRKVIESRKRRGTKSEGEELQVSET